MNLQREADVNDKMIAGVVLAVGLIGALATFQFVPALQGATRDNTEQSTVELERARRLLHQFDHHMIEAQGVLDMLRQYQPDANQPGSSLTEDQRALFDDLMARQREAFDKAHWQNVPSAEAGMRDYQKLQQANAAILASAQQSAQAAVSAENSNAEAHRVRGVVAYHQGLSELEKAMGIRVQAVDMRGRLASLASEVKTLEKLAGLGEDKTLAEEQAEQQARADALEADINTASGELDNLKGTIDDLQQQLADAERRADQAREQMEKLKRAGVDLSNPEGGEAFAGAYEQLDADYRQALEAMHIARFGGLPKAELKHRGNILDGEYVEDGSTEDLTLQHGLNHYDNLRNVKQMQVDAMQKDLDALRADIRLMADMKGDREAQDAKIRHRMAEARQEAGELASQLAATAASAEEAENHAIQKFSTARQAFSSAASNAASWVREGSGREVSEGGRASSAFLERGKQRWLEGYRRGEEADVHLAIAWANYLRSDAMQRDLNTLQAVADTLNLQFDATAYETSIAETRTAGINAVNEAMNALQKAHGSTNGQWTMAATAAGGNYMLVLFGVPDAQTYLSDAINNYRNALSEGRDQADYTATLSARLAELSNR